ncbi:MAG: DUF3014 domain-containing protein [Burkholderiales bacterium]|nr:DUF3014 domain-containing protein [Burkholderiales bacterium]
MPQRDPTELRPPRPRSHWGWAVLVLLLVAAAAYWWLGERSARVSEPASPVAQTSAPPAAPAQEAPPAEEPASPLNPIEAPEAAQPPLPALADADTVVGAALGELLGAQRVGAYLQVDGFVRRVVATVDNLAREQAPAQLWPVHPMPGRFTVQGADGAGQIAPANAARYGAFVAFAEAVPLDGAVQLYTRLYPLFQAAYEELGFPGKYFNDRLVAVIDHLLAAPEPAEPVAVRLVPVAGEVPSLRPWVRYEYADAALQSLSAGQKIMVRVGRANERRLKAVLTQARARVARAAPKAQP